MVRTPRTTRLGAIHDDITTALTTLSCSFFVVHDCRKRSSSRIFNNTTG